MRRSKWVVICIFLMSFCVLVLPAEGRIVACDTEQVVDDFLGDTDFSELQELLEETTENPGIDLKEMVYQMINGEKAFDWTVLKNQMIKVIEKELNENIVLLKRCFLIAIFSALFARMGKAFENEFITRTGIYVGYLLICSSFLHTFSGLFQNVKAGLENVLLFMKAICPIYFTMTAASGGQAVAAGGYQVALLVVTGAELIIGNLFFPLVETYFFLSLLNYVTEEKMLGDILELFETVLKYGIKILLCSVIGLNAIQGLLLPSVSKIKNHALLQTGEAIPVVGDAVVGATELVLGICGLIRNAVGAVGIFGLLLVGLYPVIKLLLVAFALRLESAVLRPMGENMITECIGQVGKSIGLMGYLLFVSVMFCVITLLILSYSLN